MTEDELKTLRELAEKHYPEFTCLLDEIDRLKKELEEKDAKIASLLNHM